VLYAVCCVFDRSLVVLTQHFPPSFSFSLSLSRSLLVLSLLPSTHSLTHSSSSSLQQHSVSPITHSLTQPIAREAVGRALVRSFIHPSTHPSFTHSLALGEVDATSAEYYPIRPPLCHLSSHIHTRTHSPLLFNFAHNITANRYILIHLCKELSNLSPVFVVQSLYDSRLSPCLEPESTYLVCFLARIFLQFPPTIDSYRNLTLFSPSLKVWISTIDHEVTISPREQEEQAE